MVIVDVERMAGAAVEPTIVWGVPLSPVTMAEAIAVVERRIDARMPAYLISANLNYAMLCANDVRLAEINRAAVLVLVDGMPLVWASRSRPRPLPERVAGSDLIFALADMAARRGFGVFFVGGGPRVAAEAASVLIARYPGLRVLGTESPPFGPMSPDDEAALLGRIRASGADVVIGAFSQPRGEAWIAANHRATGASICVQIGASLDFAAGRVRRAPRWVRRFGMEWSFRLALEPRRLAGRYARNAAFLLRSIVRDRLGRNRLLEARHSSYPCLEQAEAVVREM